MREAIFLSKTLIVDVMHQITAGYACIQKTRLALTSHLALWLLGSVLSQMPLWCTFRGMKQNSHLDAFCFHAFLCLHTNKTSIAIYMVACL